MRKILTVLLFMFGLILVGCNFTYNPNKNPEDLGLSTVKNEAHLKLLLESSNVNDFFFAEKTDEIGQGFPIDTETEAPSSDFTNTNIQVDGVDEGDIIKTDGSKIYSINNNKLQVINILDNGKMDLIFEETITSDNDNAFSYYSELYLTDMYLVVVGIKNSFNYPQIKGEFTNDDIMVDLPFYYFYTTMSVVEVYDKETFEKVANYSISGYNLGTRLINNKLYLISNYRAYYYPKNDSDFDLRPWYYLNDEFKFIDYKDIKYIPNTKHNGFTIISTINLDNKVTVDKNVFLSPNSWGTIHVSKHSIYLAYSYYEYNSLFNYINKGTIISYQIDEKTGKVSFGGKGEYKGEIINQFAIDEHDGYLRLATTEGWGTKVVNRLFIFKRELINNEYKLKQISLLDTGLGKPGERIQSVRFNKDIATVVTFLQTDPFYTIDLSNPYEPKIIGELEIPGFSSYQHPWTDNLVIGIGYDADDNGTITGIKVALYDISNFENPIEVGKPLIFEKSNTINYIDSEATRNHKAIMIDKARNLIGMELRETYLYGYKYENLNRYVVLDIDETRAQPIQVKYSINHHKFLQEITNNVETYYYNKYAIRRAFRIDDYLYVLSGELVTSHNLTGEFDTVDYIILN